MEQSRALGADTLRLGKPPLAYTLRAAEHTARKEPSWPSCCFSLYQKRGGEERSSIHTGCSSCHMSGSCAVSHSVLWHRERAQHHGPALLVLTGWGRAGPWDLCSLPVGQPGKSSLFPGEERASPPRHNSVCSWPGLDAWSCASPWACNIPLHWRRSPGWGNEAGRKMDIGEISQHLDTLQIGDLFSAQPKPAATSLPSPVPVRGPRCVLPIITLLCLPLVLPFSQSGRCWGRARAPPASYPPAFPLSKAFFPASASLACPRRRAGRVQNAPSSTSPRGRAARCAARTVLKTTWSPAATSQMRQSCGGCSRSRKGSCSTSR